MVAILLFLLAAVCLLFLFHCREAARLRRQLQDYNQGKSRGKLTNKSLFPGMTGLAREIHQALWDGEDLRENAAFRERRLRESIANLGHDLRTPLTVLQGYSDLLQGQPECQTESLHALQEKCAQLTETADQFAQWHQAQDMEMPLYTERFDLVDLLAACVIE
jgi:signal transduction histidine kinase